jgi:hypothetical protein
MHEALKLLHAALKLVLLSISWIWTRGEEDRQTDNTRNGTWGRRGGGEGGSRCGREWGGLEVAEKSKIRVQTNLEASGRERKQDVQGGKCSLREKQKDKKYKNK